jgi:hypothetical protein
MNDNLTDAHLTITEQNYQQKQQQQAVNKAIDETKDNIKK